MLPSLSIIVPVLNEARGICQTLQALAPLRARGVQVIVVDGGSTDDTVQQARLVCDAAAWQVIESPAGRAAQMNAGAKVASAATLLFLHADTVLPAAADILVARALNRGIHQWGRFDVRIAGKHRMLRVVAAFMNRRSRWSGIATGDQALFMNREAFDAVGGFPHQPLMEDVEMSRRLLALSKPVCLRERVLTSGRRWETHGVWHTIVLMWRLRWAYWRGAAPQALARLYE